MLMLLQLSLKKPSSASVLQHPIYGWSMSSNVIANATELLIDNNVVNVTEPSRL
jgi:hypothetical protein